MIAYVVSATSFDPETKYGAQFRDHASVGLDRMPDGIHVMCSTYTDHIFDALNAGLEWARTLPDLEAVVFIHPDLEILDETFETKLRVALRDPAVAVVGVIGALNFPDMRWWLGSPKHGWVHHKPNEGGVYFDNGNHEVHIIDGQLFAMSATWAKNYRFPTEVYEPACHHVYAESLCCAARLSGQKIMQIDSACRHWTVPGFAGGQADWNRLNEKFKSVWGPQLAEWNGAKA